MSARSCARNGASSCEKGSSRSRICGRRTSARPNAMRCRSPQVRQARVAGNGAPRAFPPWRAPARQFLPAPHPEVSVRTRGSQTRSDGGTARVTEIPWRRCAFAAADPSRLDRRSGYRLAPRFGGRQAAGAAWSCRNRTARRARVLVRDRQRKILYRADGFSVWRSERLVTCSRTTRGIGKKSAGCLLRSRVRSGVGVTQTLPGR